MLGAPPGQASACKLGYAGFPKGTTALRLELTLMARARGFLDAILATQRQQPSGGVPHVHDARDDLARVCRHTSEEMVALTALAEAGSLQPVMTPGAEQILRAVARLAWDAQDPKEQAALARQLPVEGLIPLRAAKGLRQAPGGRVQ